MDENRNTSITLFVLMGIAFVSVVIYVFVILPRTTMNTLGSSDLVLDSPLQKWNIRYVENGIIPFCQDGNEWLGIEVEQGTSVYTATDGVVLGTQNGIVSIEVSNGVQIQYSTISYLNVFRDDYVHKGDIIGRVDGQYLNLRVKDTRRGVYECPYLYLNSFARGILEGVEENIGEEIEMCECQFLDY